MTNSRVIVGLELLTRLKRTGNHLIPLLKWVLWTSAKERNDAWRPHIDGLRAISVLAVLFYHVDLVTLSGGFVGVDVFFVISGFLISKVIYDDIASHGRFRITRFYERRARRILPVFWVVTATAIIAGSLLFLPDEFAALGRSAAYACAFTANIFFYQTSGYFAAEAITKPLLHYWSLGVEEQFYIVFPLVVLVITKTAPRLLGLTILSAAVASFCLAEINLATESWRAFFLAPPRAWELMAGCLLALPNFPRLTQRVIREFLAAIGLALILLAVWTYSPSTPFPGATAVVPVAGAAFILWACEGSPTAAGSLLSVRPLRSIGLWSYSIYMIHWPLIVFARTIWPHGAPGLDSAIVAASIGLGCLSYFLIEIPFRAPRRLLEKSGIFAASAAALVLLSGVGLIIASTGGFPNRLPIRVRQILAYNNYDFGSLSRENTCFLAETYDPRSLKPGCWIGGHPSALLWGDSTAAHYYEGLKELFPQVAILQANMASCPPVVGVNLPNLINCKGFNDLVLRHTLSAKPDLVILSAIWPHDDDSLTKLDATLKELRSAQIHVAIIGRGPIYRDTVPNILARRLLRSDDNVRGGDEGTGSSKWGDYYMKRRYSGLDGIRYISFQDNVCKESECALITSSGVPAWWDEYHFTLQGARFALERMFPAGLFAAAAR